MSPPHIPGIAIRRADPRDASDLPAIENSAGDLFRQISHLAHLADGDDLPAAWYRDVIARGESWVAASSDRPVGFLCAEADRGTLHIWELGVRREWQRLGVGRALMDTAIHDARQNGLVAVTLTTFIDVSWNAPFYAKLGFEIVSDGAVDDRLANAMRQDAERGLPPHLRCAMRLSLA